MNAYERTLQADLVDLPEAQQLEILQVLSQRNIAAQDVITWLRERKLWFEGQQGYRGPVQAAYESTESTELKDAIDYLWATLFGDQKVDVIRTTEPQWAMEVNGVLEIVLGLTQLPEDEEDQLRVSFYAMGGDRPWRGAGAAILATQKAAYDQAQADAEVQRLADEEAQRLAKEAAELERQQAEQAERVKEQLRGFVAAKSAVALERIESSEVTTESQIAAIFSAE